VIARSGFERSGASHQVGPITDVISPLGRSLGIPKSDVEREGTIDPQACPVTVVINPLGRSLAITRSDLEHVNEMDQIACPSTDVMPTLGHSLVTARSGLKYSEANDPKAGTNVDSNSLLGCSLVKARSDVKRVEPIDEEICCICIETISQGESKTITLPCCAKHMHNDCMWEVLKNQPATSKCPLC